MWVAIYYNDFMIVSQVTLMSEAHWQRTQIEGLTTFVQKPAEKRSVCQGYCDGVAFLISREKRVWTKEEDFTN